MTELPGAALADSEQGSGVEGRSIRPSGVALARRGVPIVLSIVVVAIFLLSAAAASGVTGYHASASARSLGPRAASDPARMISLSPVVNDSFTNLQVTLANFPSDGQATVSIYNSSVPSYPIHSDPSFYMNSSGGASQLFTPPFFGSAGTYIISANESGAPNVTATFTDSPGNITLSAFPSTVTAGSGTELLASGNGLPGGQEVNVYIGSESLPYQFVDDGYTSAGLDIPDVPIPVIPAGTYILFLEDDYGDYAATTIQVTPAPVNVTVFPTQGTPGTAVVAYGTGLGSSVSYNVYFEGNATSVCTGISTDTGGFTCDFYAPADSPGIWTVEVIDADLNSGTASFKIDAIPHELLLASPQQAQYFLSLPGESSEIKSYDYSIDDYHGFLVNAWALVIKTPPGSGEGISTKRQGSYAESYLLVNLTFTADSSKLLLDFFHGTVLSNVQLLGFTNDQGQLLNFLDLEFTEMTITTMSLTAGPTLAPYLTLNWSFSDLTVVEKQSSPGENNPDTVAGTDESPSAGWEIGQVVTPTAPIARPPPGFAGDTTAPSYLISTSQNDGEVQDAKSTGTIPFSWVWSPGLLNVTLKWSGGADLWFLTTPKLTWLNVLAYTGIGEQEHKAWAFEFTRLALESMTLVGVNGYVPFSFDNFAYETLSYVPYS